MPSSSSSSSPALNLVSSGMSAAKRMLHGLSVPIMAVTVYAVVYAAFAFAMLNPYLMLAMVTMGAYQNLQVKMVTRVVHIVDIVIIFSCFDRVICTVVKLLPLFQLIVLRDHMDHLVHILQILCSYCLKIQYYNVIAYCETFRNARVSQ